MSHPQYGDPSQRKPSANDPDTQPNNRNALVSLILAGLGIILSLILGGFQLGVFAYPVAIGLEIVAIIFGHRALKEIHASGDAQGGRGMAVAGLALGYVVLAISVVGLLFGLYLLLTYQP